MLECNCGCGNATTGADFLQGHDENVRSAVMYVLGENTMELCRIFGFGPNGRNAQQLCTDERERRRNR